MRRVLDLQLSLTATITGVEPTSTRRRRREFDEAALLDDAPQRRSRSALPEVNWHEGGEGPALLLLNGSTASGLVWPDVWLRRLEKRFRVIRVDNRGTGWSRSASHPFTIADLADDARSVLGACGIRHATVLGLSLGGMIAQELAIRHPEAVDRLVLVATRPPTPAQIPSHGDALLSLMKTPPRGGDLRAFIVATWSTLAADGFAAQHPAVFAEIAEQIMRRVTPRRAALNQARAVWSWHGAARLGRIGAPTTIVHGDRDPLLPVGNGMRLGRLIPDATYLELPGVGHLVPQEAGDALLQALES
jgi:pimeloyl-ACP methyl ester carboxylesterase